MFSGMSPVRLFSETSGALIFFSLPTSTDRLPVSELCDKLSKTDKEERQMTCGGISPLKLFCEISMYCKYWQSPILGGMLPSNLFPDK